MGKRISRTMAIQSALVLTMLPVGFCLRAEAQDTTSQNANSNVAKPKSTKQRKTARQSNPKTVSDPSANTEPTPGVTSPTENAATVETKSPRKTKGRGHQMSTASTSGAMAQTQPSEQTDLSGTYAGTFSCEDAGMNGETTLTITGNQFTTSDGKTGRIVATTTSGYTAVALQLGELTVPAAGPMATTPPKIISLRARKSGERLTLTSAAGSQTRCTFTPSRAVAGGRKSRRAPQTTTSAPAATGTEVSGSAETVPATAGPTPPEPATRRAGRRGAKKTPNVKPDPRTSTGTPTPVQDPMPSPSPTPTGSPSSSPTPSGSPTPSPSPTPTPGLGEFEVRRH